MIRMNAYIDTVVTEMDLFDDDINSLFYDIVIEEEVAKDTTQASKEEPGMVDKMIQAVKQMLARISGLIQQSFLKFKNYVSKVAQSDKGFEKEFNVAFKKNKPLEAIKLVSYDYNTQVLDQELKKISDFISKLLKGIQNKTSYTALSDPNTANDLDRTPDEIYSIMFKELGCSSEVKDINTYFLYLKNKYRGEKKEILFKSSQTNVYRDITKDHDKLGKVIGEKQSIVANQVAVTKANLHNTIQNKQANPEVKKRAVKQCKNVTHLMNFYMRFIDVYTQLQLERLFTYRTVLKKLYNF